MKRTCSLILSISILFLINSCKKECPVGYEGSDCKSLSREKFIGKWNENMGTVSIGCNGGALHYLSMQNDLVQISTNATATDIISIQTGYGSFSAKVKTDSLAINEIDQVTGTVYNGRGFITSGGRLALSFTISDNCINYSGSGEFRSKD